MFVKKGYKNATMKDIVEVSGMSRGVVYMYFSSTEEMFRALLEWNDETGVSDLNKVYDSAADGKTAVEALILGFTGQENDNPSEVSMFPAVCEYFFDLKDREPEQLRFLQSRYDKIIGAFVAFLQAGVNRGYFSPILPLPVIAKSFLSWTNGFSMHRFGIGDQSVDFQGQTGMMNQVMHTFLNVHATGTE